MSYQVIARKWRPQTFDEVTGQENITQTLRNALEHDRLHHAYLFSGARGVGKTTTARLLAKALNCHKTQKPNLVPCSSADETACASCIEIAESRSIDVLEIDAASHTGIDDVRGTILDNISINPARDRYKVFIIDEVHQLSKQAFNALLKTLEEPPSNVVFIMATTELHKVPETILSRCQEFEFRTIPLQKIYARLKLIAEIEKIDISEDALREIARSGEGSMRDAQSNFDQVISFSGEQILVSDVSNALGMASVEMLTKILGSIAEKDAKQTLDVVDDLVARGQDLRNFSRDLLSLFRDLLVFKIAGSTDSLFETSVLSRDEMQSHAAAFSEADFLRFFNSLCETETKLKDATQSRYVLEIGLIKLIEMRRVSSVEDLLERLARLERSLGAVQSTADKAIAASESPASEKKTLRVDPAPEEAAVAVGLPPVEQALAQDLVSSTIRIEKTPHTGSRQPDDLNFRDPLRFRLASIDSDELEHVEDTWLDSAFEDMLLRSGDDLLPIHNASGMVEAVLGYGEKPSPTGGLSNGASATATAPAREKTPLPTIAASETEPVERPRLSENPSEEELFAYANSHPIITKAMQIFRAKVVGVKKI